MSSHYTTYNNIEELVTFADENPDDVDWKAVSSSGILPEEFIRKHHCYISWDKLSGAQSLSVSLINDFSNKVCWRYIGRRQSFPIEFYRTYKDKLNWTMLSKKTGWKEEFIDEFAYYVKWGTLCANNEIPERLIKKYKHLIDCWGLILRKSKLSEKFIREHLDCFISNNYCRLQMIRYQYSNFSDEFKTELILKGIVD